MSIKRVVKQLLASFLVFSVSMSLLLNTVYGLSGQSYEKLYDVNITGSTDNSTVWVFEPTETEIATCSANFLTYTVKSKLSGKYLTAGDNGDGTVSLCGKDRDEKDNGQLWAFYVPDKSFDAYSIINAGCADPGKSGYCAMLCLENGQLKKAANDWSNDGDKSVNLKGTDAGISDIINSFAQNNHPDISALRSFEATINYSNPTFYFNEKYDATTEKTVNLDSSKKTVWEFVPAGGDVPTHSVYAALYTVKSKSSGKYLTAVDNGDGTVSLYAKDRDTSNKGQLWGFDALWGTGPVAIINAGCADPCAATDPGRADYCAMLYLDGGKLKKDCQRQSGDGEKTVLLKGTGAGLSDVTTKGIASDGNNHPNTSLLRSFEATINIQFPALYFCEEKEATETVVTLDNTESTAWKFEPVKTDVSYNDTLGNEVSGNTVYTMRSVKTGAYLTAVYDSSGTLTLESGTRDENNDGQLWILHRMNSSDKYYGLINLGYYSKCSGNSLKKCPCQIQVSGGLSGEQPSDSNEGRNTWELDNSALIDEIKDSDGSFTSKISSRSSPKYCFEEIMPFNYQNVSIKSSAGQIDVSKNGYKWKIHYVKTSGTRKLYTVKHIGSGLYLTFYENKAVLSDYVDGETSQYWEFRECSSYYGSVLSSWTNVYEIRNYDDFGAIYSIEDGALLNEDELKFGSTQAMNADGGRGWTLAENRTQVEIQNDMECVINSYQWGVGGNYYLYAPASTKLTGISFPEKLIELRPQETKQLTISYEPSDAVVSETPIYTSDDESVASVDSSGKVTAKKLGTTQITATVGTFSDTCTIKVTNDIKRTQDLKIMSSLSSAFDISKVDEDERYLWKITYQSDIDNRKMYTVMHKGSNLYLTKQGSKVLLCQYDAFDTNQLWEIKDCSTYGSDLSSWNKVYEIRDYDNTGAINSIENDSVLKNIKFSQTMTVGPVGGRGWVFDVNRTVKEVVGEMTCVINSYQWGVGGNYYMYSDISRPITSISFDSSSISLAPGEKEKLSLKIEPSNTTDKTDAIWSSSDSDVVTVDNLGNIKAGKIGKATVSAKIGGFTAECSVEVKDRVIESITLNKEKLSLTVDTSLTLKPVLNPANVTEKYTVSWSSSNDSTVSVDKSGKVTAKKAGGAKIKCKITALSGEYEAECDVDVPIKGITSVSLSKKKITLIIGENDKLSYTIAPSENDAKNIDVIYSVNNNKVAKVDKDGNVESVGIGKAVITVTVNEIYTDTCEINVVHREVEDLILSKKSLTMLSGESYQLTSKIVPSNTTVNKNVLWSSSRPAVAMVTDGKIVGIKPGTSTISAKVGKKTTTCKVTVKKLKDENKEYINIQGNLLDFNLNALKNYKVVIGDSVGYTNSNGEFSVAKVPVGGATVNVYNEDNELVYSRGIIIEKGKKTSIKEGIVTVSGNDLKLSIKCKGSSLSFIKYSKSKDNNQEKSPDNNQEKSPKTKDAVPIVILSLLSLTSLAIFIISVIVLIDYYRKRIDNKECI